MKTADEIIRECMGSGCRPLRFKQTESNGQKRWNMVTDSIAADSLLGGVATALIFSTLICNKNAWRMRLITRTAVLNPKDFYNFLKLYGLKEPEAGVEFVSDVALTGVYGKTIYDEQCASPIEITSDDVFMATSWWSAKALLDSDFIDHIFYIIQEIETFFYPNNDMQLWCHETMQDKHIDFIVNTSLVYDYLKSAGYESLASHAVTFEPAFPEEMYHAGEDSFSEKTRYKFFLYGRPNHSRNLFGHGIEIVQKALDLGIINPDVWDICMAGGDIEAFCFRGGVKPRLYGRMSWMAYSEFARNIDLALCLMYTPHPSYPPYDMLASGAVVLTNNFANKRELGYSGNLIMADLDEKSFLRGLEQAVKIAKSPKQRRMNYENQHIGRSWEEAFKDTLEYVTDRVR